MWGLHLPGTPLCLWQSSWPTLAKSPPSVAVHLSITNIFHLSIATHIPTSEFFVLLRIELFLMISCSQLKEVSTFSATKVARKSRRVEHVCQVLWTCFVLAILPWRSVFYWCVGGGLGRGWITRPFHGSTTIGWPHTVWPTSTLACDMQKVRPLVKISFRPISVWSSLVIPTNKILSDYTVQIHNSSNLLNSPNSGNHSIHSIVFIHPVHLIYSTHFINQLHPFHAICVIHSMLKF